MTNLIYIRWAISYISDEIALVLRYSNPTYATFEGARGWDGSWWAMEEGYRRTVRVPSSFSSMMTFTVFSGKMSSMSSGHSMKQR